MKMSEALNVAFNKQIEHEFLNKMKYIAIYSFFEDMQLLNLAARFKKQAEEEESHAQMLIDHLNARLGAKVRIAEIPASDLRLNGLTDVANAYMETELMTTEMIQDMLELAESEKSFIDRKFLEEFIHQQIEEEDHADEFVKKVALVKDILLFDATLGG